MAATLDLKLRLEDDMHKIGAGAVRDGVVNRIEPVILRTYRSEKFSGSRWVVLGGIGRSVIGGMLIGLCSLLLSLRLLHRRPPPPAPASSPTFTEPRSPS